jgi:hypothetical protein
MLNTEAFTILSVLVGGKGNGFSHCSGIKNTSRTFVYNLIKNGRLSISSQFFIYLCANLTALRPITK